jgi:histidyl-tRNA synthetase
MLQVPKGTFDVLPDDAARREALEREAKRILGAAGYRRIETPTFESTALFARAVGEATDIVQKEMYSFDDGGGRSLTLRPEGTAPVCRAYVEHGMHKLPQPVKLWYLESFFRSEAPQRGRYRQFWQVGAEAIGSEGPETDAELIVLLSDLLDALGVRARLKLASLGQPETRAEYREVLIAYLREHSDALAPEVRARIELNPMRAFDSKDPRTQAIMREAPKLIERLATEDLEHFEAVRDLLDDAGLRYEIDPTMVRGLDYYTRTLFEFDSEALDAAQSTVGGGGRYDRLIEEIGGPPTPGVGWAAGVERMLLAAGELPVPRDLVDLFVALADPQAGRAAFALTREARRAGLQAQLELAGRALRTQLRHADRIGARYVAIVGGAETSLKEMESGEQRELAAADVIPTILRGSRLS